MPFYYPNWINDFWRIMGIIFFGDKEHFCIPGRKSFDEASIREFCTRQGMAFYDTACEVRRLRDNASDAFLEVVTPTDIPALLRQIPHCYTVVTTGQKATEVMAATFSCDVPAVGGFIKMEIPDQVGNDREWKDKLKALCGRYAAENISPGGAADMLSLTIFIDSII